MPATSIEFTLTGTQTDYAALAQQWGEDDRYWRVVEETEGRRKATWIGEKVLPFRWCSVSCTCESCLDTDAVIYAYDSTDLVDLTGIQ